MSSGRASIDEALIVAYLQGTLPAEARAALEDRLADDSDARRVVSALASLSIFSSTLPAGEAVRGASTTTDDRAGSSLPAPAAGELLAEKYRVVGALGHGAMGIVLEVEHVLLRERYALKLLRRATAADPLAVQRLVREARAAMRIDSPHVARVFDLGVLPDGRLFLVMELLTGRDLKSILAERGALPVDTAVAWIAQAARGVAAAHAAAVVHRDLKPANLFVIGEGDGATIKVVDFGLSKAPEVHRRASDDAALTTSGSMIGSPMYMAPEQIRDAKTADARGDVWALGVVLYEMLAGKPPFSATTVSGVLASIMVDEVPSLAAHAVPPSLERVILACLEKRQAKRMASAEALLERLARWQEEEAPTPETSVSGTVVPMPALARARRWPLALGASAAAIAGGLVALAAATSSPTLLTARASALQPASPVPLPAALDLPVAAGSPAPSAQSSAVSPPVGAEAPPRDATSPAGAPARPRRGAPRPVAAPAAPSATAPEVVFGKETEQRQ